MMSKDAKRRARKGEGTIYANPRGPGYVGEISLGKFPDGRRNRPKVTGRTVKEVRKLLKDKVDEHNLGIDPSGRYTVGDAVKDWLEHGLTNNPASSVSSYRSLAYTHVIPRLGARKLKELTALEVETWLRDISPGLAKSSLTKVFAILKRSIRRAQKLDRVARNVAELAEVPKAGSLGRPSKSMTLNEFRALIRASQGHWLKAYIVVSGCTGLRPEEVRALRWEHVHLNPTDKDQCSCGRVHSLRSKGQGPHFEVWRSDRVGEDTKTAKSRRTLGLPKVVAYVLAELHAGRQTRIEQGKPVSPYVFCTSNGTKRDASNIRRDFVALQEAAGIPAVWVPRELRHTFVSVASEHGMSEEEIADIVGHALTSTTRLVYRHQLKPVLYDGAQIFDGVVGDLFGPEFGPTDDTKDS